MAAKRKIYSFFKRSLIILLMLLITFSGYVAIVTRNSKNMTIRQRILKAVYPAFMWYTKLRGKNVTQLTNEKKPPPDSSATAQFVLHLMVDRCRANRRIEKDGH